MGCSVLTKKGEPCKQKTKSGVSCCFIHSQTNFSLKQYLNSFYNFDYLKSFFPSRLLEIIGFILFLYSGYIFSKILMVFTVDIFPRNFDLEISTNLSILVRLIVIIVLASGYIWFIMKSMQKNYAHLNSYAAIIILIFLTIWTPGFWIHAWILKLVIILPFGFLLLPAIVIPWRSPKWIILFLFLTILIILTGGLYVINDIYGKEPFPSTIQFDDCNNTQIGVFNMTCSSPDNIYASDYVWHCQLPGDITGQKNSVEWELTNGTDGKEDFYGNFTPKEDTSSVMFTIKGKDRENNNVCWKAAWSHIIISKEEYKENRQKFITYFLALIGFCLLSVPIIFKQFKDLLEK